MSSGPALQIWEAFYVEPLDPISLLFILSKMTVSEVANILLKCGGGALLKELYRGAA